MENDNENVGKDMKVLFFKDPTNKINNCDVEMSNSSKGVNTDIALSPKLIEKVQNVLSLNILSSSSSKIPGSTDSEPITSASSINSALYDTKDVSNVLLVPLFMMNEKPLNNYKRKMDAEMIDNDKSSYNGICNECNEKITNGVNTNYLCLNECDCKKEISNFYLITNKLLLLLLSI